MPPPEVVIVGAGLAGLCCARRLFQCGKSFQILEASDGVGGRLRTDEVDGFLLDRGFQIYLTAYPEGRRVLDLEELDLCCFKREALIWYRGRFHAIADPRQAPLTAVRSLGNPIGTLRDKWRLGLLAWDLLDDKPDEGSGREERLTLDLLRWNAGFSEAMIDRFWRPFLGSAFLESKLVTSSRFFRFLMQKVLTGDAALPARGMRAIPEQIAARLPQGSVLLNRRVERVEKGKLTLTGGSEIISRSIVIATEGPEAARLIGSDLQPTASRGATTLYYATQRPPLKEPLLMLDGENKGPVNNLAVMSAATPTYAPPGTALISASVIGVPDEPDERLDFRARNQLGEWFGPDVARWRLLRVYRIAHARPDMTAGSLDPPQRPVRIYPGLYVCGDHRDNGSIDGAMASGFRAAQTLMEDMHRGIV
jgi:phytoene dehydrogenase-like protein